MAARLSGPTSQPAGRPAGRPVGGGGSTAGPGGRGHAVPVQPGRYRDDRERGELLRIGVAGLVGMVAAFFAGAPGGGWVRVLATAVVIVAGALVSFELVRWLVRWAKARSD